MAHPDGWAFIMIRLRRMMESPGFAGLRQYPAPPDDGNTRIRRTAASPGSAGLRLHPAPPVAYECLPLLLPDALTIRKNHTPLAKIH